MGRGRLAQMSYKRQLQARLGLSGRNDFIKAFLDDKGLNSCQLNRPEILAALQDYEAAVRLRGRRLNDADFLKEWEDKFKAAKALANSSMKKEDEGGVGEWFDFFFSTRRPTIPLPPQ